jgi:hypothetical protein
MLNKNRKGQVGETLTWVVATLILIFILMTSIYFTIVLGKAKNLETKEDKVSFSEEFSLLSLETSLAHVLSGNKNQEKINLWIENEKTE